MDQGNGTHVCTGLFAEDDHVLQAARHGCVIGRWKIVIQQAPEINNARQPDHECHNGHDYQGGCQTGQTHEECGSNRCADSNP